MKKSKETLTTTMEKAAAPAARGQFPLSEKSDFNQTATPLNQVGSPSRDVKRSGPTSKRGKKVSRRNAVKHGILATVLLLEGESRTQFEALLRGFRDSLKPEGMVEDVLVEKLASLKWRYRRMLAAERAEIQMQQLDSSKNDERKKQQWEEAIELWAPKEKAARGLLARCDNPFILEKCLDLLKILRSGIENGCKDPNRQGQIERLLFDELTVSPLVLLLDIPTEDLSPTLRKTVMDSAIPFEERKAAVLEYLDARIEYLKINSDWNKERSEAREDLEIEYSVVLDVQKSERLLRYSASLERDFDRTLNQFERLQRIRSGQPVLPAVNVNISRSS